MPRFIRDRVPAVLGRIGPEPGVLAITNAYQVTIGHVYGQPIAMFALAGRQHVGFLLAAQMGPMCSILDFPGSVRIDGTEIDALCGRRGPHFLPRRCRRR